MNSRSDIGQFVQQSDVIFIMIASSMSSRNNMMQQIASFIVLFEKQVLSNYCLFHLLPTYRQKFESAKPGVRTIKRWTNEADGNAEDKESTMPRRCFTSLSKNLCLCPPPPKKQNLMTTDYS